MRAESQGFRLHAGPGVPGGKSQAVPEEGGGWRAVGWQGAAEPLGAGAQPPSALEQFLHSACPSVTMRPTLSLDGMIDVKAPSSHSVNVNFLLSPAKG